MKNTKLNANENGFSLLEMLMAVALLGAAVVYIMALIPNGYVAVVRAGRISTMSHLAYDKIDELKRKASADWDDADLDTAVASNPHPAATGTGVLVNVQKSLAATDPTYLGYSMQWTVTSGPEVREANDRTTFETDDQVKYVTVTVAFNKFDTTGTDYSTYLTHENANKIVRVFQTVISSNR
jgi:prepilin-type N-terminal cleavage/methylation domain-containing protein